MYRNKPNEAERQEKTRELWTKRISNLLHSQKWEAVRIEEYLWQRRTQRAEALWAEAERPLVIWDESVLEKPESLAAEGLCAVRSVNAGRLKRIKPGYYNPPGGRPIFVPGFHWLQVWVLGPKGPPTLAHLHLQWTARQKLLLLAALAHAYLLSFLPLLPDSLAHWLLQHFCPRTGKRSRDAPTPLYRLRLALSLFWFFHSPPFLSSL